MIKVLLHTKKTPEMGHYVCLENNETLLFIAKNFRPNSRPAIVNAYLFTLTSHVSAVQSSIWIQFILSADAWVHLWQPSHDNSLITSSGESLK
jgi:hypothetical protein